MKEKEVNSAFTRFLFQIISFISLLFELDAQSTLVEIYFVVGDRCCLCCDRQALKINLIKQTIKSSASAIADEWDTFNALERIEGEQQRTAQKAKPNKSDFHVILKSEQVFISFLVPSKNNARVEMSKNTSQVREYLGCCRKKWNENRFVSFGYVPVLSEQLGEVFIARVRLPSLQNNRQRSRNR